MGKLEGRVALVTGSGRNIGRATVLKLAAEGANVIVNSRSNSQEAEAVANEARALGVKALSLIADVAKKTEVDRMLARAMSEFGRVDILINNAAIRPHKAFTELTLEDWEEVRGVVLDGAFYLTKALIEPMVKNKYGRILFFTGEGAFTGGSGRAHVSAAKMGLVGLARALAVEFAAHNIRANVVSPASIPGETIPNGIADMCRVRPAFRSVVRGMSMKLRPPACSWSATTAASSPVRPSTSTAVPASTDGRPAGSMPEPPPDS